MRSRDWADDAVCGQMDTETADALFFGRESREGAARYPPPLVAQARAVCETCAVIFEGLVEVLDVPGTYDRYGIRGGLLPDEREDLRAEALRACT